jgi:hypothetical protein
VKKPFSRAVLVAGLALTIAVAALAGTALAAGKPSAKAGKRAADAPLTVAVFGDFPYGLNNADVAESDAAPAFVKRVNDDPDVSMVIHVGDIHSGKQQCTQAYDEAVARIFSGFADPLVYTPGDNETTDCNKAGEGGGAYNATTKKVELIVDSSGNPQDFAAGNPIANTWLVRQLFFAKPGVTLGKNAMRVDSQAVKFDPAHPTDAQFVENVMFEKSGVLFVTLDIPGGSNNDQDPWYATPTASADQLRNAAERTGATIRWIAAAFAKAKADKVAGVVVAAQADMWDPEKGVAHQTGYDTIITALKIGVKGFAKPVLMFNGDSHVYRSDNPMSPTATCLLDSATPCVSDYNIHPAIGVDLPNFHRVVVHGSTAPLEYLKLTIDTSKSAPNGDSAFGPFAWERKIQADLVKVAS